MAESTPNDEDRWSASLPAAPAEAPAAAVVAPKDSPLFADTTRVSVPNLPRRESAELRERTTDIGLGDPAGGSTKPFATYNPGNAASLLPPVAATRDLPRPSSSPTRNPPSRPPAAPAAGIPGEHAGLRVAPPARPVPGIGPYAVTLPPGRPVSRPPPPPPPASKPPPPPPPTAVKAEGFFERASGEFGNAGGEHTPVIDGRLTKLPPPPIEAVPARPTAPSEPEVEAAPAPTNIADLFGEELPSDPPPPGEGLTETSTELMSMNSAEAVNASGEEGSASIQVNLDAPGPDALLPTPLVTAPTDDPPVADSASDDEGPAVDPDPTTPIAVVPPVPVRPLSSYLPALGLVAAMLAVAFGAASIISRWLTLPSTRRPTTTMAVRPAPQRPAPQPPQTPATCRSSRSFTSPEAAIAAGYFPCHRGGPAMFYCSIEAAPVAATRPRFCRSVRRACSSQNGSDACLANPLAARVAHGQRGAD